MSQEIYIGSSDSEDENGFPEGTNMQRYASNKTRKKKSGRRRRNQASQRGNNNDESFSFNVKKIISSNVLIIGLAGAGKTSLFEIMVNGSTKGGKIGLSSDTKEFTRDDTFITIGEHQIGLIDSPGIGDSDLSSNKYCQMMNKSIGKVRSISKVLVLLMMCRLSKDDINQIRMIMKSLVKFGCKPENVNIILTKTDLYTDDVKLKMKNDIIKVLKEKGSLDLKISMDKIHEACLANPEDFKPQFRSAIFKEVSKTRNRLINILVQRIKPFRPLDSYIDELEKNQRRH